MPPVATGLVLLMLFAPRGALGGALARLGIEIVFTWKAVVIAMAVMGMPLLVRTARAGFEQVDQRYESVAATLGARPLRVFLTITLPLALPAVAGGAVLSFARAIGEFGATMMVAGRHPRFDAHASRWRSTRLPKLGGMRRRRSWWRSPRRSRFSRCGWPTGSPRAGIRA